MTQGKIFIAVLSLFNFGYWIACLFSASNADDRFFFFYIVFNTCSALIGSVLLAISFLLKKPSTKRSFQTMAMILCMISIIAGAFHLYRIHVIMPRELAESNARARKEALNRKVYQYEESNFDPKLLKIVRWKKHGDRRKYIQSMYTVSLRPDLILIIEKKEDFAKRGFVFDGAKAESVDVKVTHDFSDVSGELTYHGEPIQFTYSFQDIGVPVGDDDAPEAPLMRQLWPGPYEMKD